MKRSLTMALVPALALLAACGRKDDTALDDSLRNDLALASSVQPYQQQQFVSPMEQGMAIEGTRQKGRPRQERLADQWWSSSSWCRTAHTMTSPLATISNSAT